MSYMAPSEAAVGRKKNDEPKPTDPPFERLEFQAPPGFTARLDRARKKRGLSRSAYLRQAALLLMLEDEKKD